MAAYASRSLLEHGNKWTATELKAAALIWALETFRPYIDGVHVTIRTDHASLEYIRSKTDRCKRLESWARRLQEFKFINLDRPTRRGRKSRAGKEVRILAHGHRVGAAHAPARTHNRPTLASSPIPYTLTEC